MRRKSLIQLAVPLFALVVGGCGTVGEDFQAGNRLTVTGVEGADGGSVVIANAVEKTDDSGLDGNAGTADTGEGNRRPDYGTPGEAVLEPLSNDLGTITLRNETRLGVDPGVALTVYRIDITYVHPEVVDGRLVEVSEAYAPTKSYNVTLEVASNATTDLTNVVLVPVQMKVNGLRDIFLFGSAGEIDAVRSWRAIVDVYARDPINDDDVHAQGQFSIQFIEPMREQ